MPVRAWLLVLVLAVGIHAYGASAQILHGEGLGRTTQVLGFTDINYLATERDVSEGFVEGQMVGHVAAPLSDRLAFFGEFSATARPDGFSLEVERSIIRYDFADVFKLSAGRYHTPVSYWNTAYHHGTWLHTSVARPEMVKFGGTFLPVHFVGLLAEGNVPGAALGLRYTAGVGNGRGDILSRGGDAGDANGQRAFLAGLTVEPAALFGLQVGGAVYRDQIGEGASAVDETILSAHLAWEKEQPELLAEYARVMHDPTVGDRTVSEAYYAQVAYRLPGAASAVKPYARYEHVVVPTDDVVFAPLELGYEAVLAGVRYDFATLAALKGEYRRERFGAMDAFQHSVYLQVSFAFGGLAF